jgi:toxin FitB
VLVLDTNVISELMRPVPAEAVLLWVATRPASVPFTTTVSEAEARHGLALMPEGLRLAALLADAEAIFGADLEGLGLAAPDPRTGRRS